MRYSQSIRVASSIIWGGGVIAYPTEGVFGLGCDPFNPDAVGRILDIKQRPLAKGVILIASDVSQLKPYLKDLSQEHWQTMNRTWPGPFTWVVPHNGSLPQWITGRRETVAVRVTNHPVASALCSALKSPLVSTSANRSGRPALHTSVLVRKELGQALDYIVGGRVQTPGKASHIQDLLSGQHYRA